ncbi:MAG: peptidase, partial [Thermomicrobiales bacterium]|nr:peptidase [Thermomicrobiales bacterium]
MTFTIDRTMADAIIDHLRAALPNEGCGLLATEPAGTRAMRFYPGTNVAASPTRYTMAPEEVLTA